ncbi:hypothetical protein PN462_07010 [Spirulina sp. CS-785/01]|uniref:hypothetical protein n=1 Tax=Spirulina sp. CS-785/01 TaxID=3021716 RepID=UPI002330D62A|nr:hypothetical protein [Spirulina sp. CS-785/01]MDB9312845.1 hypothetical protein [Spirulina sp. CS-785/01]
MSAFTLSGSAWMVAGSLVGSLAIASGIISPPAFACSPFPGSQPTPISERIANTQYVFMGTVTHIEENTVTVQVHQYFQGQGPQEIKVSGFNSHSCSDYINETGQEYLFFAQDIGENAWSAVYDGAFGSIESWNGATQVRLAQRPNPPQSNLPQEIADQITQEIATRFNLPPSRVEIINAERQTWPNGCLGEPWPGQLCTLALVEGWSVQAQAKQKRFNYRTDLEGNRIRLENGKEVLPKRIQNRVLREINRRFSIPRHALQLTEAYPRTWDGCYGLADPNQPCTMQAIFGWQVVVESEDQRWVFHTDGGGSELHFNDELSQLTETPATAPAPPFPIRERERDR